MSTRFVAPPPPPPLHASSSNSFQDAETKNGPPPPPVHPALARRRTPIPPYGDSFGALNSFSSPRSPSPAPPVPPRPSQLGESGLGLDIQPPADDNPQPSLPPRPSLSDTQSGDFDSAHTRSSSNVSILSSETPSTPLLLVTQVGSASTDDVSGQQPVKTDTLPPYASQPELPAHIYPDPPRPDDEGPILPPALDTRTPALQYHSVITETPTPLIPPPPVHPSRQPSPSPSFSNLPVPTHPTLRHRTQSNVSNLGTETPPNRPAIVEHARRGSGASILTLKDENLTDNQLRAMYDAEEVERYLRLFASRVNEVALHPDHADTGIPSQTYNDEEDWVSLSGPPSKQTVDLTLPPNLQNPSTPFEYVAAFLYPYVPQPPPLPAKRRFKLTKASNSAQRLYLAMYPAYIPAIVHLWRLSIWKDPKKSGFWCAVYWTAWAAGLLTPLITGRVLYALVTGGTVTREEIKRRREAAREAEALGKAIQGGIPGVGVSGELSVWDVAKLFRSTGKKKRARAKAAVEEIKKGGEGENVIEGEGECEDPDDWKLMLVDLADELADLHERVKNIFLHRRPAVTRFYTFALTLLFIATIFIQNTSKLITLGMGFFFWFIPPVVRLLPRLPPAFADAPTDAEVAMELISRRVERGERVVPERISRRKKKERDQTGAKPSASVSSLNLQETLTIRSPSTTSLLPGSEDSDEETEYMVPTQEKETPGVEQEDKFRKGAVRAWNWLGKTKQLMDQVRGVEGQATVYAAPGQSFPAQHRSRPGMLIISSTLLTFSPLFAAATPAVPSPSTNVIKVDIEHLRSVKKVSPSGLLIRYVKGSEVVEERFYLLSGRDEAFATLVGWGGGRWKHV
ncbi:transmembrane protein [Ceratobasidium sp. AG-Ba]|nr:transmembrane protein [Ceratobasidium sp. AG-Ba]QRW07936.1 transmembrane protein [Ceratobasidium sp. AG-Ba]